MPPKSTGKTYVPRKRVLKALKRRKSSVWRSLLNPGHVYRHVVRGVPFYITNNFTGGGLGSQIALPLKFGDLVNATEFKDLYDTYKIISIKYTFFPCANVSDMSALDSVSNPGLMQPLFYVIDYDDATPIGISDIFQYPSMKSIQYGKKFSIKFQPHVNMDATTPSSLSRVSVKSPWLDIANTDTLHFGVKMFIADCLIGTNNLYVVHTECHCEFRGQR